MFIVVAAALIDESGKVLVQRRPEGTSLAGLWEFPGGKPEIGETPEVALARELMEELGIAVDPANFRPITFASEPLDGRHLLLLLYVCRKWQGELRLLHASELRWIDPSDLGTLEMPPADYPLAEAIERFLVAS